MGNQSNKAREARWSAVAGILADQSRAGVNNPRMSGGQELFGEVVQEINPSGLVDDQMGWMLDRSSFSVPFFLAAFCPFDVPLRLVVNVPRCAALSAVLLPGITKWRTGMQRVDGAGG